MSLLLMVVLLAVFLWNVDFAEVGQSIAAADPLLLAAACLVALLLLLLSFMGRSFAMQKRDLMPLGGWIASW